MLRPLIIGVLVRPPKNIRLDTCGNVVDGEFATSGNINVSVNRLLIGGVITDGREPILDEVSSIRIGETIDSPLDHLGTLIIRVLICPAYDVTLNRGGEVVKFYVSAKGAVAVCVELLLRWGSDA